MRKLARIWNTVRYLKYTQVYHQILNRTWLDKKVKQLKNQKLVKVYPIILIDSNVKIETSLKGENIFAFLNIRHSFKNKIDWNYSQYGKLWTYNLTYFDFLNQDDINRGYGLELILTYIKQFDGIKDGNEPYPISLRCINWIKFISRNSVSDETVNKTLFIQYNYLINNLEYHLLGNHLLENAFSLLWGSYYFQSNKFYNKAKSLLQKQLEEQILTDGGHFELSPMYHKILLFRLLDSINVISNNTWKKDDLFHLLKHKAHSMLSWLETMTYSNGSTANVNDSTDGTAPTTMELLDYAKKLGLNWKKRTLTDSGYRMFKKSNFELLIDIGNIGPDYIPGHAHADTFNFELVVKGQPIIVDTGISTYEKNKKRKLERSTISHNTVIINNKNQSDVWGGFRVGKRAKIISLEEKEGSVKASHNGYNKFGVTHSRTFQVKENKVVIIDEIESNSTNKNQSSSLLHFHPDAIIKERGENLSITNSSLEITFTGASSIECKKFEFCQRFNKTKSSTIVLIHFNKTLTTTFLIK